MPPTVLAAVDEAIANTSGSAGLFRCAEEALIGLCSAPLTTHGCT